jgi:hypothetical protein
MEVKGLTQHQYAMNHPAGRIGKRLVLKVSDVMKHWSELPLVKPEQNGSNPSSNLPSYSSPLLSSLPSSLQSLLSALLSPLSSLHFLLTALLSLLCPLSPLSQQSSSSSQHAREPPSYQ